MMLVTGAERPFSLVKCSNEMFSCWANTGNETNKKQAKGI
jgi:hypothetical protein